MFTKISHTKSALADGDSVGGVGGDEQKRVQSRSDSTHGFDASRHIANPYLSLLHY